MSKTLHLTVADRIGDALFMALLRAGVKLGTMSLLTVRGRKSGQPHTVPVLLVEQEGVHFLVAPYGVVQRVRNLRARGEASQHPVFRITKGEDPTTQLRRMKEAD